VTVDDIIALRDAVDGVICDLMVAHGPDGHVDGHEALTEMVMLMLDGFSPADAQRLVYEQHGWPL